MTFEISENITLLDDFSSLGFEFGKYYELLFIYIMVLSTCTVMLDDKIPWWLTFLG